MTLPRFNHRALPVNPAGEGQIENERRYRAEIERAFQQGDLAMQQIDQSLGRIDETIDGLSVNTIPFTLASTNGTVTSHPVNQGIASPGPVYRYNPNPGIWSNAGSDTQWRHRTIGNWTWHITVSGLALSSGFLGYYRSPGNSNDLRASRNVTAGEFFQWRFQTGSTNNNFYGLGATTTQIDIKDLMIEIEVP